MNLDVRIVCTHDGVKTAEKLARVLAAEDFHVEITYGRNSLAQLQTPSRPEAVILIWSLDASVALYMLQWQRSVDPARLIEIARASTWPDQPRKSAVIDFSTWNGERGGSAWRNLQDRLRAVARACEPPKPAPKRAAVAALGAMSALAVGGALLVRIHETPAPQHEGPAPDQFAATVASLDGQGGPLQATEPASMDDMDDVAFGPAAPRAEPLAPIVFNTSLTTPAHALAPLNVRRTPILQRLAQTADSILNEVEGAPAPNQP